MMEVNFLAVLAAAFASFVFGALWYSPIAFLKRWCHESGVDPEMQVKNPATVYGLTFVLTLFASLALAFVLGPKQTLVTGGLTGLGTGVFIVATSLGINYQFSKASLMHWVIDSGFHIGRFTLMGLLISGLQ